MSRTLLSIGLVSVSLLAFQLVLMQVLSIMQWHHFASMVIAIALLGFGASGTVLSFVREWAQRHSEAVIPWSMICAGLLMPLSVGLAQVSPVRFDSLEVFTHWHGLLGVFLTSLSVSLPFFFAAVAIGLTLARWPSRAPSLYFSNMVGSGAGAVLSLGLMWWVMPERLPAICGACAVAAGLLLARSRGAHLAGAGALALCAGFLIFPPQLVLSEFKAAAAALRLPQATLTRQTPSPDGLLQEVSSPALRAAPGVSLTYGGEIPACPVIYSNGDRIGPLVDPSDSTARQMLRATTYALPYAFRSPDRVLILDCGSAVLVAQAVAEGARTIFAVEPNERIAAVAQATVSPGQLDEDREGRVSWHVLSARTFLGRFPWQYDLITIPPVGAFGGGAGLSAMEEEYTLTVESLEIMWHRLSRDGMLALSAWMDYPPRTVLKLAATIAAVADRERIPLSDHLAAVRGWGTVTFVLSRSALRRPELERIRAFSTTYGYDPLLLKGLQLEERMVHHALQDSTLFSLLDSLLQGNSDFVEQTYPFRVTPAVDDRPYFHQFLRLDRLGMITRLFGSGALPFVEAGYAVVLLTAAVVLLLAILLILVPLVGRRTLGGAKGFSALVFAGLGIGYMATELSLIQRLVPVLGTTVASAGIVMAVLLISSGAGSLFSARWTPDVRTLSLACGSITGALGLLLLVLPLVLPLLLPLQALPRVTVAVLLVALPGFLMGMPFPLGLRLIGSREPANIPWVWGINGACSVAGASLAPIIAVEFGVSAVLALALGAYAIVAASGLVRTLKPGQSSSGL